MRTCLAFLQKHEVFFILFIILILLRIPNLFEPYWYGDEAIYLTVGNALRHGLVLYRDIIDHKTPLIYFFAMVPSQFWFKFLFLSWMAAASTFFYSICLHFFGLSKRTYLASAIFIALTTLPWFEGHIANGELFVIGFVLAAVALFIRSSLFATFEHQNNTKNTLQFEPKRMFAVGFLASLGVLTKVPAVFDIAALAVVYGFVFLSSLKPLRWKNLRALFASGGMLTLGILTPILISILYFASRNALGDYASFGLLYNFKYTQEFSVPITQPMLRFLFTMPGKLLIVGGFSIFTFLLQRYLRPAFRFILLWFMLALFASLLSSRPYPHYFQQAIPPFALLISMLCTKKYMIEKMSGLFAISLGVATLFALQVGLYSVRDYYTTYIQFATRQISSTEYQRRFNALVPDTYTVARLIQSTTGQNDRLFIWGTNPMLYALSKRIPAGRFTVSFHIKDFDAYKETMDAIQTTKPPVIIVMKEEDGAFDAFYTYLHTNYVQTDRLPTMTVYRRANWK